VNDDLVDFTICSRISLNYLRGRHNYWFSIGNGTKNDLLIGGELKQKKWGFFKIKFIFFIIFLFLVFNNSREGPKILVRKYHPKVPDEAVIELDKYEFQAWHSYCFVFSR